MKKEYNIPEDVITLDKICRNGQHRAVFKQFCKVNNIPMFNSNIRNRHIKPGSVTYIPVEYAKVAIEIYNTKVRMADTVISAVIKNLYLKLKEIEDDK